jgi:hypothetical protein
MITRHGFSPTQPCVTRLGLVLCVLIARGGDLNVYAGVPLFRQHPLVTRLCCFSVASLTSSVPVSLSDVFRVASSASRRFLPTSRWGSYPGSGLASHSSSTLVVGGFWVWWGGDGPPMSFHSLDRAWKASQLPYPLAPATRLDWGPRLVSSCPATVTTVLCHFLVPRRRAGSLLMWCSVDSSEARRAKWYVAAANSYRDSLGCWTLLLSRARNASTRWCSP